MTVPGLLNDLELLGALVVGSVAVVRARPMIRATDSRLLWLALVSLTIGQALQVNQPYRDVEHIVGVPGSAALIKHAAALFAAANTVAVVQALRPKSEVRDHRRAWLGLAVALPLSIAPWIIDAPTRAPAALANRAEYYDATWRSAVHWLAFLGYLSWSLLAASRLCWRFRRVEKDPSTRIAVTLVGVGTTIGLGYIVEKALTVAAWLAGLGPRVVELDEAVEAAVLTVSVSLIATGVAYDAAATRVGVHRRERDSRRALTGLRPFIDHIAREYPDVHMPNALTASEAVVAGVAVVHEGLRRLTAYAPASWVTSTPASADQRMHRESAWLRRALQDKATGAHPRFAVTGSPIADTGHTLVVASYLTALYEQAGTIDPAPAPAPAPRHAANAE